MMAAMRSAVRRLFGAIQHFKFDRVAVVVMLVFVAGAGVRLWYMAQWRPAFLGYGDSAAYVSAAVGGFDYDTSRPGGYALFLRLGHAISAQLSYTIALQHLLGIATAALLYLAVRRATGSRWLGLMPAAVVLFDGFQVTLEHSPMSEALFTFLVAGALLGLSEASTVAGPGPRWRGCWQRPQDS